MSTAITERAPSHRPNGPNPGLEAACRLMQEDWSSWHVVLYGLRWEDYRRLLAVREEAGRKGIRITYDRGAAEIWTPGGGQLREVSERPENFGGMMSVGNRHERLKKLIAILLENLVVETGGSFVPSGALTISREDLDRGFEPDECFYFQNAHKVVGLGELNFANDPPPDLVVEIEVSRSILDKLEIILKFGVPEVWRYSEDRVSILLLQADGSYRESASGLAFPWLPMDEFARFIPLAEKHEYATIIRQFRKGPAR